MDNVDVACARYIQNIVVRPSHPDSSIYLFPHLPAYYFNDRLFLWTMWMLHVRDTYKTLSSVLHIQTHPFTCFPICQLTTLTTVFFMDNVDVACARYIQDIVVRPSHPDSSIYLFPHLPAYYFNDRLFLWTMWMLHVRDTYKTLSSVLHIQTHPFTCFPICQLTTLTTVCFYGQCGCCMCEIHTRHCRPSFTSRLIHLLVSPFASLLL